MFILFMTCADKLLIGNTTTFSLHKRQPQVSVFNQKITHNFLGSFFKHDQDICGLWLENNAHLRLMQTSIKELHVLLRSTFEP